MPWRPADTGPHGATYEVATYSVQLRGGLGHVYFIVSATRMQRTPPISGSGVVVMGRTRGGPAPRAVIPTLEDSPDTPIVSLDGAHIVPISLDGLDRTRLESMRQAGLRLRQPAIGELVRESAARAQTCVPFVSENTDIESFRAIVRLMVAYYYRTGHVDARRALRRASIDQFLTDNNLTSRRTVRWQLYGAGRMFYPGEFPRANVIEAPREQATAPSTEQEVAALYTIARTLNPKWRRALTSLVDFTAGVGARSTELHHLRRGDVRIETINGRQWTLVTLQRPSTPPRTVPVRDQRLATRIQDHAEHACHDLIMAFGRNPSVEGNGINRVNDRLRELEYEERFDAKALRNFWLVQTANVLPMLPFMQLAGFSNFPRLSDMGLAVPGPGDLQSVVASLEAAEAVAS